MHPVETCDTTTQELLKRNDRLRKYPVTDVAMEATYVYWKPVWPVLEGTFERILANAMHIKNVPGRKTDVNDATWIADLLAHGLIRASFVPPTTIQDMRTRVRTRKQLVRERAQHVQRIQKTIEDANVKIASLVNDGTGTSGRVILKTLLEGKTSPEELLATATGRFRASHSTLLEALRGSIRSPHRFLLKLHLGQIDAIEQSIADSDKEVGALLDPFRAKSVRLMTMSGLSDDVAYPDLGSDYFDRTDRKKTAARLVKRLGDLNFTVEIKEAALVALLTKEAFLGENPHIL